MKDRYPAPGKGYLDPAKDSPELVFDGVPLMGKSLHGRLVSDDQVVLCPRCLGHGGWNLVLNEYGAGKHFRACCSQCWGYGYVAAGSKDDECGHHDWQETKVGNCLHELKCKKCGRTTVVDSSD